MNPYFERDGIVIYHGDCREILPGLRGDALVTDPPFGINWSRGPWDDDPAAYPQMMRWLVHTSMECIENGHAFVFQAMPNVGRFHEWFPEGWRIFAACKNFAQIRPTSIWHSWDPVVFWKIGNPGASGASLNRDYHVGNVAGVFNDRIAHPCPRPLDTMAYICNIATGQSGTILDPFMGSGTTLRAALDLGRRAIGIEIEERYCEIAAKRLDQMVLPLEVTA